MDNTHYVLANFGGPRTLKEVEPFLRSLLTDQEVVRTGLPQPMHAALFHFIAKRRAKMMRPQYADIGGGSPIYEDTEAVAEALRKALDAPLTTFHRYIPATHKAFIKEISAAKARTIRVFPMFPQFTYATTGSVALWMNRHLPLDTRNKLRFVKSYPDHPAFITAQTTLLQEFLKAHSLNPSDCFLLFSAHGIPFRFVAKGDPYQRECETSFQAIRKAFPEAKATLAYQSKFGPGEWLRPYTSDIAKHILEWSEGRENIIFIPISFTSDHIETLHEVEYEYMPPIRTQNLNVYRAPALNRRPDWLEAIPQILHDADDLTVDMLCRHR